MKGSPPNGWNEWSRHVLAELIRLQELCRTLNAEAEKRDEARQKDIVELKTQMSALQVKAGLFGAVGAAIPIIGYFLLNN